MICELLHGDGYLAKLVIATSQGYKARQLTKK